MSQTSAEALPEPLPGRSPHARDLPLLGSPPPERRDAARNRLALLEAAEALVSQHGVDAVTMEAVAARAGVGKGTVFRRFGSREGLMGALLNFSETAWQGLVIAGPPPLGPGAPAQERLLAFGRSRLEQTLRHAELIRAAGAYSSRSYAAYSFTMMHVRYLLEELGVTGDLFMLATALLAPLEVPILEQQVHLDGFPLERVHDGWVDLARRVVGPEVWAEPLSPGGGGADRR